MNTFSLDNLHFLDDIEPLSEKNTIHELNSTNEPSNILASKDASKTKSHLNSTSSSEEVELDENLNTLNLNALEDFEASEANSLKTIDYSELDQDQPYQSIFTLNTFDSKKEELITTTTKFEKNENGVNEKSNNIEIDLEETNFKPRPYRPKSAIKRQTQNFKNNENKKLNPLTINKRPLLSHNFWTDIENAIEYDKENLEMNKKNDSDSSDFSSSFIDESKKALDKNNSENKKSLSIEQNEGLSKESSEESFSIHDEQISQKINNEQSFDSNDNKLNNSLKNDQKSNDILNELMDNFIKLFDSRGFIQAAGRNDNHILEELKLMRQIVENSNLNRNLEQFKHEIINEFDRAINEEFKSENSTFKLEMQNLEQQFYKNIKQLENKILNLLDELISQMSRQQDEKSQKEDKKKYDELKTLILNLCEKISYDEIQSDKLSNDLSFKVQNKLNDLSNSICNLNSKIDIILNEDKKRYENFSSLDEASDLNNVIDKKNMSHFLDTKLDTIEHLIHDIHQKTQNYTGDEIKKILLFFEDKFKKIENDNEKFFTNLMKDLLNDKKFINNKDSNSRKSENELSDDKISEYEKISEIESPQLSKHKYIENSNEYKISKCDLCEMANNIRKNIESFRTTFYRQKIRTYSKCDHQSDFTKFQSKIDQPPIVDYSSSKHDHSLDNEKSHLVDELESRMNLHLKTYIHKTSKDIRNNLKELKQLGNYNFKSKKCQPSSINDGIKLKQIQQVRFKINRHLIKLNQMIINNY